MKRLITPSLLSGTFLIPIFLFSCSYEQSTDMGNPSDITSSFEEKSSSPASANSDSEKDKEEKKSISKQTRKLIKTGNLSLKSQHIEKSKVHLDQILKSLGGYYDNEQFNKSNYEFRYSLKLRVPAKNFDQMLQTINGGEDEIISKDIQTDDVSGEYLDLETRLKSKRAYLKRYEELLKKANNIDELLQIESQIRQLIEEIESQESRLNFLDDQVGYSTLDIELFKTITNPVVSDPGFSDNAQSSLSKGWTGITTFVLWLLSIWPLLLILIPAGIFGYRKLKNQKK